MDESFAVFHEPLTTAVNSAQTRISLFRHSSDCPYASYRIPFLFVSLAWYRPPLSATAPSSYTLVGITSIWSIVLLGDHVEAPEAIGSSARELGGLHSQQKRTLFQDIFGVSAFADVSNVPTSAVQSEYPRLHGSQDVASLFEGPAYLMPSLETLFDPVMKTFLNPRIEGEDVRNVDKPVHSLSDEDVDMDQEGPILVTKATPSVIDPSQMEMLVDLFRTTAVKCKVL